MKKKKIILGSISKFRKSLLSTINIEFSCISPNIDEKQLPNEKPKNMALRLAIEKGKRISQNYKDSLVISSDACAVCEGKILGKPITETKAQEYLKFISEKTIFFYTSICLMDSNTMSYDIDLATYEIKIKKLSEKVINDYINKYKPLNSSAAFRYEVAKDILVDSFIDKENDISGLIGLPLIKLKKMLEKNNIITD